MELNKYFFYDFADVFKIDDFYSILIKLIAEFIFYI